MSQILDEQLSVLLDGELPAEELDLLLARLERDPASRATLARYGLIGEALRGGLVHRGAVSIAERVQARLEPPSGARSVGTARSARAWGGWLAAGLAASITAVAVLVLGPDRGPPGPLPGATPALATLNGPVRTRPLGTARMTSYLVYHSNYTAAPFRGTLNSHLIAGRVQRAGWQQPAEDLPYGR